MEGRRRDGSLRFDSDGDGRTGWQKNGVNREGKKDGSKRVG